jgi:hypothetical protein
MFSSADARSFKPSAVREAKRKAREKARKIAKRKGISGKLVDIRCVG